MDHHKALAALGRKHAERLRMARQTLSRTRKRIKQAEESDDYAQDPRAVKVDQAELERDYAVLAFLEAEYALTEADYLLRAACLEADQEAIS